MKKSLIILILLLIYSSSILAIEIEEIKKIKIIDKRNTEVSRHIYGIGNIANMIGGQRFYIHQDRIQSTRLSTNSSGRVNAKFKSLPFGQELINNGIKYSFATGKELDSSGLYYFGVRYYDPHIGRFISVDPIKENNAYSYVKNNPMNYVDPNGLDEEDTFAPSDKTYFDSQAQLNELYGIPSPSEKRWTKFNEFVFGPENNDWDGDGKPDYVSAVMPEWIIDIETGGINVFKKIAWVRNKFIKKSVKNSRKLYKPSPDYWLSDAQAGIDYEKGISWVNKLEINKQGFIVDVRGNKFSGNGMFDVLEDGSLVFAKRRAMLPDARNPHPLLSKGGPVRGAGESWINEGKLWYANPLSGHFVDPSDPIGFSRNTMKAFWESADNVGLQLERSLQLGPHTEIGWMFLPTP